MTKPDTEETATDGGATDAEGGAVDVEDSAIDAEDITSDAEDGAIDATTIRGRAGTIRTRVPWRRIGNAIGLIVLIAIVLPFVIYAVPQVVGAEQSYVVLSGSMEPAISPGDVIVVESVEPSDVEEGDVITYARDGESRSTTHRVTDVTETDGGFAFETKGDANEGPDQEPVAGSQVAGRVMTVNGHLFVIPYIGYVVQFAGTQLGFVTLVVAPIALFVLSEVRTIVSSSGDNASSSRSSSGSGAASEDGGPQGEGGSDGVADSPPTEDSSASSGGLTLRANELRLGLVVTAAFAAYSVWVAYVTLTVWAIGVAASVATAFLLLAGLYLAGGNAGPADDRSASVDRSVNDPPPNSADDPVPEPADDTMPGPADDPANDAGRGEPVDGAPSLAELWATGRDPDGSGPVDRRAGEGVGPPTNGGERAFDESNAEPSVNDFRGGVNDD